MKNFFAPNIDRTGRLVRAGMAAALLSAGVVLLRYQFLIALLLLGAGLFVLVEALRGWCALRACGIKTKL